jgi:hypothetical protein
MTQCDDDIRGAFVHNKIPATMGAPMNMNSNSTAPLSSPDLDTSAIDFTSLNPVEMTQIHALARRAEAHARRFHILRHGSKADTVYESNFEFVCMDFAVVHLRRKLDLRAMLISNDFEFTADYATMQKYILRPVNAFPLHARLRFASIGATFNPH